MDLQFRAFPRGSTYPRTFAGPRDSWHEREYALALQNCTASAGLHCPQPQYSLNESGELSTLLNGYGPFTAARNLRASRSRKARGCESGQQRS
ncbi:hypothetical protein Q31a_25600 [Aureliella helgolandensis]|uniref:Uncharacterized protein n=1 Tax=Aureliella helgolandensis TaxID=2527968 RepID=A0A518G6N6_9BACT|nr:hypothetical protein Q31a_25600 [Aureliella helgolandensis]